MSKENLFEGITITSPQDLERTISGESSESTDGEESNLTGDGEEGLTISPIGTKEESEEGELEEGKEKPSGEPSGDDTPPASNNKYAAIIKDMIKEGVLNPKEEAELEELLKDASADTLKKLMSSTLDDTLKVKEDAWKSNFTGAKKKFLEIEDAFTDTDKAIETAQRLEFFENVTKEDIVADVNLAKNIYFDYLKSKGFSDANAAEEVTEAEAMDKVAEKALKFLPDLTKDTAAIVETSRAAKESEKTANATKYKESFDNLMKSVEEKEAFIPGMPLNKTSKEKLKNNITTPVYTDEAGKAYTSLMYKQMRNPAGFELMVNYLDTIGLFDLDKEGNFKPDISKLKGVAKTQAVSELDKVLSSEAERGTGRGFSADMTDKTAGLVEFFERATGQKTRKK